MGGRETEKSATLKTFSSELRRHLDLDLRPTLVSAEDYLANNATTEDPDDFEFISYADEFVSASRSFSTIRAAAGAGKENGVCSVPVKKLPATFLGATAAKPQANKAPVVLKAHSPSAVSALLRNVEYSGVVVAITKTNFSVVVEDGVRVVVFNLRFHPALGNTKAPCSDFVAIGDIVGLTVQPRKVSKTLPELWAAEFCWIGERPAVGPPPETQPLTGAVPQLPKSVPQVQVPSVLPTTEPLPAAVVPLPLLQVSQAEQSGHEQKTANNVPEVENEATIIKETFRNLQMERNSMTAHVGGITLKSMWMAFMKFTQSNATLPPAKDEQCVESQETVKKPQVVPNHQADQNSQPVSKQLTVQETPVQKQQPVENPQPAQNLKQPVQNPQPAQSLQPKGQPLKKQQPVQNEQAVQNSQPAQNSQPKAQPVKKQQPVQNEQAVQNSQPAQNSQPKAQPVKKQQPVQNLQPAQNSKPNVQPVQNLQSNVQPVQNLQSKVQPVQKQQPVQHPQPKVQQMQKLQPLLQQPASNQQTAQNSRVVPNQQTEKISQPEKSSQLPPKNVAAPSGAPSLYKNVVYAGVVVAVAKTAFVVMIDGIRVVVYSQYFEPTYGRIAAACSDFVRHGGVVHLTVVRRQPGKHYRELWAAEFCWVPVETAADIPGSRQQGPSLPLPKTPAKVPAAKAPVPNAPVPNAPISKAPVPKAPVSNTPVSKAPAAKALVAKASATKAPGSNAPVTKVADTNAQKTADKGESCPKKVIRIEEACLGLEGGVSLSVGKLRLHGFPLTACSDLTQLLRKGDLAWVKPGKEGDLIGWLCAPPPPPEDPSQEDPLVEACPSADSETALLSLLTKRTVGRDLIMDILNSVTRPPVVYDEWEARGNFSEDELDFINDGEYTAKEKTAGKKKKKKAKPVAAKPTTAKPTAAKSTAAQPAAAKPTAAQSTAAQPTSAQPALAQPTTAKSTAVKTTAPNPAGAKTTATNPAGAAKTTVANPAAATPPAAKPTAETSATPPAAKPTAETSAIPPAAKPTAGKAAAPIPVPNLVEAKLPPEKPMAAKQQAENQSAAKPKTANQAVTNEPETKLMAANLTAARPTLISRHTQTDENMSCTCSAPRPELIAQHMPLTSWQQLLFNTEWNV